jgi:hypothetical protein
MKKRLVGVGALAALALSLSACYSGNQYGPKVGVIGDSITGVSQSSIESAIGGEYGYTVEDFGGVTFVSGASLERDVLSNPSGPPTDIIVNFGTNDVAQGDVWQPAFAVDMQILSSAQCIVLVNVSTYADELAAGQPVAEAINQAIDQQVASSPSKFHLIDWNGFIHEGTNSATLLGPTSVYGLNVHPNVTGQADLAQMYLQALHDDCGA